eukprot:1160736-Pelagomonas_calceolata.AAC.12
MSIPILTRLRTCRCACSAPASPGACSSLSSAGPSIFTGSPMGSTPHQGHKGDASSRYRASDDQQQQFKWSENPMLSMASPAASLSTPTSGAGAQEQAFPNA